LADLSDEKWVTRGPEHPVGNALQIACREAGFEQRVAYVAHESIEIQAIVGVGLGIALLPRLTPSIARNDIAVVPVLSRAPQRRILIARMDQRLHAPASKALWDVLVNTVAAWNRARPAH
jgi:LysR family transcriptional activator of glutamate synthase operon